jgi:cystathionine gamma-synthase
MRIETKLVHGCKGYDEGTGSISFPIYQSATFRHPGLNKTTGYDYSRLQNPTREELENTLARLENGNCGFAFASGMAAVATALELFKSGEHIIVSDDLYGGTYRLFEEISKEHGLDFTYVDTTDVRKIKEAIKSNTKGIFIETPSNPMMKVSDIKEIVTLSKSLGIKVVVDNTFLTPYYQRPLELGADIVIHSGTKYLGGHNDTLAGFIVVKDNIIAERIKLIQKSIGAVLAPFDSWLILRGIKTLGVRLERQQSNAIQVANWLREHKEIEKVYYVGLPEHEGYNIMKSQASGFGAMISFLVRDLQLISKILENVKIIAFAESLGGVESLITYPLIQTHSAIPEELREKIGINDRLLRLSVGIEAVEDIISDLEQAMK